MVSASSVEYATPANWQDFERLSRALLSKVYKLPFQRWGRSGQRQNGVDIWARSRDGHTVAIQCKGRSQNFGKRLSIADLDAAVLAMESFPHAVSEFIVFTTSFDDKELQNRAVTLTTERAKVNKSSVAVWGWNTVSEHIGMYEDIQKAFYGHWFARVSVSQWLVLIVTTIALLTACVAGLFVFHEQREDVSKGRTQTVKELQKFTSLIDDLNTTYDGCEQVLADNLFVFTEKLRKSCLKPVETRLGAIDKQLQISTPFLNEKAIEEISSLQAIMREDFRQIAIAMQMTGFFEEKIITNLRRSCMGKQLPPLDQAEQDAFRASLHDAANSQVEFYFLLRDFISPSLTSMKSRLLAITRQQLGEPLPPSLTGSANALPRLLQERRSYKFESKQQPLTLSVIKTHSARSIKFNGVDASDYVERARESEVFERAMTESLIGKTKDIEALISCGVLKPAARTLETQ